ncbi:MAG: 5'/3'-nucleotidase SurE [Natrialbaceae archaeon]|nr:5'/3'-nucleotidase SurE [Natrialbaceae archaeon]
MADRPSILLTNDDGIDAPGLAALYERLSTVGDVTAVAPQENQSAVGRSLTYGRTSSGGSVQLEATADGFSCPVPHESHEFGYAVDGTPCDCVIVGLHALDPAPDVVVSGCNPGANLGAYVLSRSGTASAAMEAAMHGTPGIAVSMDTLGYEPSLEPADFAEPARIASALIDHGGLEQVDYCNLNVPRPDRPVQGLEITEPTPVYEMDASLEADGFRLYNRLWEHMATGDLPDDPGTDRRALEANKISLSPLRLP